ncbi:MAG: alpha/beta hydrolase [Cyclobacteriaceae bacterium]|nr:alpha/beta hydrolase [Cyclobacteriaceae bacterium]MBX2955857.1 alpha/beta hydrolase [Cyclobacteriaceae bacterium]
MPHINCNNASLYYIDEGAGEETIVFSHGLLFSHEMFRAQIDYFKTRYRCIAYDHRGQGQSEVTDSGCDMDSLFVDAAALIENLQLGAVHFVGLSMGGFVGMRLAARKPNVVKSLTLMETSADEEVNKLKYQALNVIFKIAGSKPISKKIMNILFGKTFMNDPERAEERLYWENKMMALPKTVTRAVSGVINRSGVFEEIKSIQKPTLVMVGDEDVATKPEKAKRIHKQINGSVLEIIPGAGHSSTIEQPKFVNAILEKFLSHVQPGNSSSVGH